MGAWKNIDTEKEVINDFYDVDTIVIYDLETDGLEKTCRILQFSAMRVNVKDFSEIDRMNIYIKSPYSVNGLAATAINGITDEILNEKGINEEQAFEKITNFIKDDDVICGYNNNRFDDDRLNNFYRGFGKTLKFKKSLDVLSTAKRIISDKEPKLQKPSRGGKIRPSYKLIYLTELFDENNNFKFHSSDEDISATAFVLENLLRICKERINEFETTKSETINPELHSGTANIKNVSVFAPTSFVKRVYVNTDKGTIFYDCKKNVWDTKTANLNALNIDDIWKQIKSKLNIKYQNEMFNVIKKDFGGRMCF